MLGPSLLALRRLGVGRLALLGFAWSYLPRRLKRLAIGAAVVSVLLVALVVAALVIVISYLAG